MNIHYYLNPKAHCNIILIYENNNIDSSKLQLKYEQLNERLKTKQLEIKSSNDFYSIKSTQY